ncbi:hypothetical protein Q7P37_004658 [Cladosporium fusiforme]
MASREGSRADATPGSILLVVHDFVARSADELSLAKGDRIELIERDDDFGDGWFLGRHMNNGGTGLFPEVYTTPAPKGTLSNAAINGARRATENLSKPTPTLDSAASVQQRQSSAPAHQRPVSANSPKTSSPLVTGAPTPTIRTSLVNDLNPPAPSYTSMNMQSPVMNETLSVINEHITDMSAPRTSFAHGNNRDTISSAYSSQPPNRSSFIAGHETDEEEHNMHTEEEVTSWNAKRVAEYLEDNGVEKSHCDAFLEQEISGDVLLAMEQSSVFMKEFDLGPVGRRLRTWHKIKALQDEVARSVKPGAARSTSEYSGGGGGGAHDDAVEEDARDTGRNRSTSAASALPRALSTRQSMDGRTSTSHSYQQPHSATTNRTSGMISPLQSMTSFSRPDSTHRPSAQNVRAMNHNRRHSSLGSVESGITARDAVARGGHRKQPSIDTKWQPGQAQTNNRTSGGHSYSMSSETPRPDMIRQSSAGADITASPNEMERGYFSSTETEPRSRWAKPNLLQKKAFSSSGGPGHSSNSPTSPTMPSISRLSDATTAVNSKFGSFRGSSMPQFQEKPLVPSDEPTTPMVTKLSYDTPSSPVKQGSDTSSTAPAKSPPLASQLPFFITKAKVKGLRATSDAVTTQEKTAVSPTKEDSSPARTGSSTPSTDQRSIDMPKSATRTSTGSGSANLMPPPPSTKRPQRKNKKETSAYTRGLIHRSPAEQIADADYSGWMKKKSGSLMTTWKPRLFVLKGRRLSYYYSETDTEEKGLIDISFHNVMVAHNDKLTGIHAAMTGASGAPVSPRDTATFTSAQKDLQENPPAAGTDDDGLFIFKLVPPKSGRGVTFTKPTVHYFAVNSRQEGRLWMAALMKAVIDREQDGVVTTTYNQKTISLAKARERKERPPALREDLGGLVASSVELEAGSEGKNDAARNGNGQGLGIEGLGMETQGGADRDSAGASSKATDIYSTAPSSAVTGADAGHETDLNAKEREAVAMSLSG